jgi:hypothetical protein
MPYFKNGGVRFYHDGVIWVALLEPMNVQHDERVALRALCPICSKRLPACVLCQYWESNIFLLGDLLSKRGECHKGRPPWRFESQGNARCGEFSVKPITFTHEELRAFHKDGLEAVSKNWFEPKRTANEAATQEQQCDAGDRDDATGHQ